VSATREGDFRLRDIAVAAYGPSAVSSIGYGAIMPVLALQARALGADVSTAAFIVALWPLGMLATSLPAGALVARLGERTTLLLAGAVDAVAMVAAALATTVWQLGICVAISGAAWTAFLIARQGYLIEAVPVYWRARAMSLLGGTFRVGVLIGPLIGAALIHATDIRAVFLLS
jgi:MFS family permease